MNTPDHPRHRRKQMFCTSVRGSEVLTLISPVRLNTANQNIKPQNASVYAYGRLTHHLSSLNTEVENPTYSNDLGLLSPRSFEWAPPCIKRLLYCNLRYAAARPPKPHCDYLIEDWPVSGGWGEGGHSGFVESCCGVIFFFITWLVGTGRI